MLTLGDPDQSNKGANMKTTVTIFAGFALAILVGCGPGSAPTNDPASTAAKAAPSAAPPMAPMLAAPKLLDMIAADVDGTNARLKGQEVIVIGEVNDAMNGFQFTGGFNKTIYCTSATPELDEKEELLRKLADDYRLKRRPNMPIVEARGMFDRGSVNKITTPYKGTEVLVFMEKCVIVSVKE
jgi:hypothetical protein